MKSEQTHSDGRLTQLFDELDREGQTELPLDLTVNSPIVDALAWCTPHYATKAQRVAILLWAIGYGGTGVSFLSLALKLHSPFPIPMGVGLLLVGARITLNAFPRRTRARPVANGSPARPHTPGP